MYHKYLTSKIFFEFLYQTDQVLAHKTKVKGCPFCGSKVHVANYMRKPRGLDGLPNDYSLRFSFCCAREGCRKGPCRNQLDFLEELFIGQFIWFSSRQC